MRRKITTTIYITKEQNNRLKTLHERTKVPIAEFIRQGIDMILEKHQVILPHQLSLYESIPQKADSPDFDAPLPGLEDD